VGFEVIVEIEPPPAAELDTVREQIAVLRRVADAFLVPDSHLGRATVSSVAVAHEVGYLGGRAIACLNARDRNVLGLRRDLLTAAAYGVRELLFVYGDAPTVGDRSALTVREMLRQIHQHPPPGPTLSIAVAADVRRPLPDWKRPADALYVQVGAAAEAIERWRAEHAIDHPIHAGVELAIAQVEELRASGAVDGVHLVPARRYREVAVELALRGLASSP